MLLFEKLLLAIAILMQICNILVKDRRNFHFYQESILFETNLNFSWVLIWLPQKF